MSDLFIKEMQLLHYCIGLSPGIGIEIFDSFILLLFSMTFAQSRNAGVQYSTEMEAQVQSNCRTADNEKLEKIKLQLRGRLVDW